MNIQANPALYPPQQAYGYNNQVPRGPSMSPFPPNQPPQGSFPPGAFSNNDQNPSLKQPQIPPQFYQQFQQQHAAFGRPQGHVNNDLAQVSQTSLPPAQFNSFDTGAAGPPSLPQVSAPSPSISGPQQSNIPANTNVMQQRQSNPNPALTQQAQLQNAGHAQRPTQQPAMPSNPQAAARERARVTVLLEINTHLLQEVVSLQAQGKAGSAPSQPQHSPTSPTSATDPSNALNNSPVDPSKPTLTKPPSQEYADCMRRLQANLAYLAATADAKKKVNRSLPTGPAIMIPPPHLASVHELYKKLNALFPEASQSTINKAMAIASAQAPKGPSMIQAQS